MPINERAWERVFRSVEKIIVGLWIKSWLWIQFVLLTRQEAWRIHSATRNNGRKVSLWGQRPCVSTFVHNRSPADGLAQIFLGRSSQCFPSAPAFTRTTLPMSFQARSLILELCLLTRGIWGSPHCLTKDKSKHYGLNKVTLRAPFTPCYHSPSSQERGFYSQVFNDPLLCAEC